MKLKMKNTDGEEIVFFIYGNGTAREIGKKGIINDIAAEYIRLKEDGYNEVTIPIE